MAKNKRNNFDLAHFKEYVRTYGEKENTDMYSNETIVKDILYGVGISLNKEDYKERTGFMKFMKWLAGMTVCAAMLLSCSSEKQKNENKFDLNNLPCGTIIGYENSSNSLVIQTDENEIVREQVPKWVFDIYKYRDGEKIGNCWTNIYDTD